MTTRTVPFFNYPALFTAHEPEFVNIFRDIGRRGAFIKQKDLQTFESRLASYLGISHALGVGNATDGLEVALQAAGVGPGDEVILSSHTMLATAVAIHFTGATPIPVDCSEDHLIDPRAVEAAVTQRTRAVMPTQLNGRTCNMDALGAIVAKHGLLLVEDAAQALGSRFKGKCAGTFGDSAAISFYPAKLLGCFGDGGAVVTNNQRVYDHASELCNFGRNESGKVVRWGFNSRLDNLQAAILNFQFDRYEQIVARRRQIAGLYAERLDDVAEVVLPPAPDADPDHFDVYQNYEIEAENRDALKTFLADCGVGTLVQWNGEAIHHLEALGFTQPLPYTDGLFKRMLLLPMNMSLSDDDVHYVCDTIRTFFGYSK
ncbi:MAG: DegT/DnrJ/EryC1/StrS family aminotransferase [Terracidiphilus sp.]